MSWLLQGFAIFNIFFKWPLSLLRGGWAAVCNYHRLCGPQVSQGWGIWLFAQCFQVTCCHTALGSQTTPSGNVLKEMGRTSAPGKKQKWLMLVNYHFHGNSLNILPNLGREGGQWRRSLWRAFQWTVYLPARWKCWFSHLSFFILFWCGQKTSWCWTKRPSQPGGEENLPQLLQTLKHKPVSNHMRAVISESVYGLGVFILLDFKIMRYWNQANT